MSEALAGNLVITLRNLTLLEFSSESSASIVVASHLVESKSSAVEISVLHLYNAPF